MNDNLSCSWQFDQNIEFVTLSGVEGLNLEF